MLVFSGFRGNSKGNNLFLLICFVLLVISFFYSCVTSTEKGIDKTLHLVNNDETSQQVSFKKGILPKVYTPKNIDSLPFQGFNSNTFLGLRYQKKLLDIKRRGKNNFNVDGLKFTKEDLERTALFLEKWGSSAFVPMSEYFDVYQLLGEDSKGSVLFTGYYTPVTKVRSQPDDLYKFPIYSKPKGLSSYPTRKQIYKEGKLKGLGLELAYAKSMIDIQIMQLQGSGYVQYEDGSQFLFSYGGSNGHPRKSIERYFEHHYASEGQGINMKSVRKYISQNQDKGDKIIYHNPSNVFFIKNSAGKKTNGAGNVPLLPLLSIATDKRYIPTGACLMASRPVPRKGGIDYYVSLLLAQDVGGGIKGPGHIDLYTGVGEKGRKRTYLRDYGELWLILAKKSNPINLPVLQ